MHAVNIPRIYYSTEKLRLTGKWYEYFGMQEREKRNLKNPTASDGVPQPRQGRSARVLIPGEPFVPRGSPEWLILGAILQNPSIWAISLQHAGTDEKGAPG